MNQRATLGSGARAWNPVEFRPVRRFGLALIRTALPIAGVGIVNLMMTFTDAFMMARLDSRALAAGAIVSDLYSLAIQFAAGALGAFAAPIAVAHARGNDTVAGQTIIEGIQLAVVLGAMGGLFVAIVPSLLLAVGVELPLASVARTYAGYMGLTFPFMTIVALARAILPSIGRGTLPFIVVAAAVPLNGIADGALMYGWWGLPRMGLAGAGAASLVVAVAMAATLFLVIVGAFGRRRSFPLRRLIDFPASTGLAKAAVFTGLTSLAETGVFLLATVGVGICSLDSVPAHVAVLRSVAITYVLATALGQATTIHVARAEATLGPLARGQLLRTIYLGLLVVPPCFAGFLFVGPRAIGAAMGIPTGAFAELTPWAALAVASLVATAAAFGLLRAKIDVRVPALISVIGYWGVGLGLMIGLAGPARLGPAGIWIGLAGGASTTALAVWVYYYSVTRNRGQAEGLIASA